MNNEDIIRMAREAWGEHHEIFWFDDDGIERFAALVAAAEREACAKVCDDQDTYGDVVGCWLEVLATKIRARGQA